MGRGRNKLNPAEIYRHETETRKNAVPVSIASYDISRPKKYEYDLHIAFLTSTRSLPFKAGKENRIAVKVIDHREMRLW